MRKLAFFLALLVCTSPLLLGQLGGDATFQFLDLPGSARASSLGGDQLGLLDRDPNLAMHNPGLLADTMHQQLAVSISRYVADINFGQVAYAHQLDSLTTLGIGVKYISYGDFVATDPTGNIEGSFHGNEQALTIMASRRTGNFRFGLGLKTIFSTLEAYSAVGLAADAGVSFHKPENQFTASFLVRNLGQQVATYYEGAEKEPLPFDVQIGLSKRLKYMPFRFMLTAHHLHQWDIRFDDPRNDDSNVFFGQDTTTSSNFTDILFRHLIVGGEFYFGKNVTARVGYNYLRRQELALEDKKGLLGFSFGIAVRVKRFYIEYGRARYHYAGGINHLSISMNLNEFNIRKRKKISEPTGS